MKFLRLGLRSFILDWQLLQSNFPIIFLYRCEFIFKKYLLILKHHFLQIALIPEKNNIFIGKRSYFYGSVFGLAVFQSMVITLNKHILPILSSIEKPVIIDVGAHLGFFSLPLASLLNKPIIYALEPVSVTFNLLVKNVNHTSLIKTFRLGLLDKPQKKIIFYNPELLMYSSLLSERFTWDKSPHKETISLNTLDAFCKENKIISIDLLKIDAEGVEERILRGGNKILSRTRYLFLECSLDQVDNSTFSSLVGCLSGKRYNFQLIKITSTLKDQAGCLLLVNLLFKNLLFKSS